ncbi:similar to EMBRYO DEFECTIVE 3147 [Actinidia rufa]|uniref:Similar to EMBRYO DEFECTIVE 3147 n=1 Tax=Actinidia rufa TaxID=165716 RepID=A0A7J0HA25_9ERIC|nr:similar to EMBRYO DEFECTIVE 3147 [Actinidia rufa]
MHALLLGVLARSQFPADSISTMSSSLVVPSISVQKIAFDSPETSRRSLSFAGFKHGIRRCNLSNLEKSRVFMSVSVGSRASVDDALFSDYKPNFAFLFPGQVILKCQFLDDIYGSVAICLGCSSCVGMGQEARNVPAAATLYKKANEILGFDLSDACINGPKEKLDSTVLSQPAIYVTSLAAVEVLRTREGGQQIIDSVDVTCGLSLGEYTALAFAGAFRFEDGLKLVKLRGEAMQDAADAAKSAMGNYAVSGGVKGVETVEAKAKSFKARMTVRLAVAGAFHTRFMEPAVSRLEAALAATEIRIPRIPVISNVDAQPHADPDTIKKILARQVTTPVQWETTVKTLLEKGLKKSYELGPGKVIDGIVKRMDKKAEMENIGA